MLALPIFLLISIAVGAAGVVFTRSGLRPWYSRLRKPPWTPPAELFAPVWSALYLMIALSGWIIWMRGEDRRPPLVIFSLQLFLNCLWSFLFFKMKNPRLAFVEILLLWIFIGLTIHAFWLTSPLAAVLLLPYWAWVAFSTVLNFSIWRRNPSF